MAGADIYGNNGMSQSDYRAGRPVLAGFDAIECDWRELFRWLISVGSASVSDGSHAQGAVIPVDLWKDHVLTILIEIVQKDVQGYKASFVQGKGTSRQQEYDDDLRNKVLDWLQRMDRFLNSRCHAVGPEFSRTSDVRAARLIEKALRESLDCPDGRPSASQEIGIRSNLPYYKMLNAVHCIKERSDEYIRMVEEGADMEPSLALLLTFVRNYSEIARKFNRTFEGVPDFYCREILKARTGACVPDKTFVVVVPAAGCSNGFFLEAGTKFKAGVLADGRELLYGTLSREFMTAMKLEEVHSLFARKGAVYRMPVDFADPSYATCLFPEETAAVLRAQCGWMLESRVLLMEEGERSIRILFRMDEMQASLAAGRGRKEVAVQLSGAEGWICKTAVLSMEGTEPGLLSCSFELEVQDAAIVPCTEALHGVESHDPVVRILVDCETSGNGWMANAVFSSVRIEVQASGIRAFGLYNELGELDASQPVYPFGSQAEQGSWLMFGHKELSFKIWMDVELRGVWNRLPQTGGGYADVYKNYPAVPAITNASFRIKTEWQQNGQWHPCLRHGDAVPLFTLSPDTGCLEEDAVIRFRRQGAGEATPNDAACESFEYHRDLTGFFRIVLQEPGMGFGMEEYRRLFAETMIYNSRHKEKQQRELPAMPTVPVLSDISLSYKAAAEINRFRSEGVELSRLSMMSRCVPVDMKEPQAFARNLDGEHLLYFSFRRALGVRRIRMYFDLDAGSNSACCAARGDGNLPVLSCDDGRDGGLWSVRDGVAGIEDGTVGLTRSGFVEIELPEEVSERWLDRDGLFRLRLHVSGDVGQCLSVRCIYMNCVVVEAEGGHGSSLPAGTICELPEDDGRKGDVFQPLAGFGGRPEEAEEMVAVRQSARMADRHRAITPKDYERLVLERFSEIEKVYCFPQRKESAPAEVRVVVLSRQADSPYPWTPAWKLSEIGNCLAEYASPFAPVRVCNPEYPQINVACAAVMKAGAVDEEAVMRRMSRRINSYFSGWMASGSLPELGWHYSYWELHSRLANDEDIVQLHQLSISAGEGWEDYVDVQSDGQYIAAKKPWYVLVPHITRIRLLPLNAGIGRAEIGANFIIRNSYERQEHA